MHKNTPIQRLAYSSVDLWNASNRYAKHTVSSFPVESSIHRTIAIVKRRKSRRSCRGVPLTSNRILEIPTPTCTKRRKRKGLNYLSVNLTPIFSAARDRLFRKPGAHASRDAAWFIAGSLFHGWVNVLPLGSFAAPLLLTHHIYENWPSENNMYTGGQS